VAVGEIAETMEGTTKIKRKGDLLATAFINSKSPLSAVVSSKQAELAVIALADLQNA